jgi:two-component system, NarL family, response regulator NreC
VSPTQVQNEVSTGKIRCVLVHEHVLLRQGLKRLLQDEPDFDIVGEAGNLHETVRTVVDSRPEVVIADTATVGLSPSEAELLFSRESPNTRLVFLNKSGQATSSPNTTKNETSSSTQTPAGKVIEMVRTVCGRPSWESQLEQDQNRQESTGTENPLTAREKEVLKLLAEGKTVRAAATDLGVSSKTVDAHKFNLMRKLNIHNKAGLVMWAIQKRLVKIPVGL